MSDIDIITNNKFGYIFISPNCLLNVPPILSFPYTEELTKLTVGEYDFNDFKNRGITNISSIIIGPRTAIRVLFYSYPYDGSRIFERYRQNSLTDQYGLFQECDEPEIADNMIIKIKVTDLNNDLEDDTAFLEGFAEINGGYENYDRLFNILLIILIILLIYMLFI